MHGAIKGRTVVVSIFFTNSVPFVRWFTGCFLSAPRVHVLCSSLERDKRRGVRVRANSYSSPKTARTSYTKYLNMKLKHHTTHA